MDKVEEACKVDGCYGDCPTHTQRSYEFGWGNWSKYSPGFPKWEAVNFDPNEFQGQVLWKGELTIPNPKFHKQITNIKPGSVIPYENPEAAHEAAKWGTVEPNVAFVDKETLWWLKKKFKK